MKIILLKNNQYMNTNLSRTNLNAAQDSVTICTGYEKYTYHTTNSALIVVSL